MNKFLSGLMATALVGSFAIASVMPANAAPVYAPKSEQVRTTDVENVNHTRRHWRMQRRAELRANRRADRWDRRREWREDRYDHSAYRHHNRRHWRNHNNGYWRDNGDTGDVRLELSF